MNGIVGVKRVVLKYGTGQPAPIHAKFLHTQIEYIDHYEHRHQSKDFFVARKNVLVWHYYEVLLDAQGNQLP